MFTGSNNYCKFITFSPMSSKRIFVAPLDWGLGHAARMVPLIRKYIREGHTVVLGGSGKSFLFLQKEFPQLEAIELPGLTIKYSRGKRQVLKLILQYPRMLRVVKSENKALQKIIREKKIDLVVSDNRYGLYTDLVPCIFITHQLFINAGVMSKMATRISHDYISRFTECHIPDHENYPGLAGNLSHGKLMLNNIKYIGPLSRFENSVAPSNEKKFQFIAVLSGPEPQRSIFEKIVRKAMKELNNPCAIVRGVADAGEKKQEKNITTYDSCSTTELEYLLSKSKTLIARSGYSTIMDLDVLNMPAILVPTPGQTEQEYLGSLNEDKFTVIEQGLFSTDSLKRFNIH
jgi:uncharacterized protein (TIGR00661 family)